MIASVEAPLALLEEPVEIILFDAVEFAQASLGLIPEILDAIDVILPVRE